LPTLVLNNKKYKQQQPTKVLFLQTFPYKSARLRESIGLGGFEEFTNALLDGTADYSNLTTEFAPTRITADVIPMALAVETALLDYDSEDYIDDEGLPWTDLYQRDNVHPSPHATWLQACLIVCKATGRAPPVWDLGLETEWRQRARKWHSKPRDDDTARRYEANDLREHDVFSNMRLPTTRQAEILRQLACRLILAPLSSDTKSGSKPG